ncbi:MAG: hypothetical protein IJW48_04615 [Clostridia bacterium]|nr:hypothetical protein [Clostridia bacterium]
MKESNCSICLAPIDADTADILTMGAYGTPKCLCDECSALMKTATLGTDYEEIRAAMDEVSRRISSSNVDDRRVIATVAGIFDGLEERTAKIRTGSYDFSLDEEEEADDVPEELLESEEDRALDERDEEKKKKWDRVLNYVSIGIIAAAVAVVIWYFVR